MRRLACTLGLLFLTACGGAGSQPPPTAEKPATLRVGLIPNQSPDKVRAQYEPFRVYLQQQLGTPVEMFVATDYAGTVEALLNNRLDIAYLGGLTYVQARARGQVHPMVTEIDRLTHTPMYTSAIVTRADSSLQSLTDLRGGRFAFGDIGSTSGSLYPRIMLEQAGFKFGDDPKQAPAGIKDVVYTGGHDATALAVQNGTVEAGGLEERILLRLEEAGTVDRNKIRLLQRSAPIEGYPWVIRDRIDRGVEARIVQAFLAIKDAQLLNLLRAEGYARVSDSGYAYIRQEAKHFGFV
jgi:phosphonate transport system substrate-binding protein